MRYGKLESSGVGRGKEMDGCENEISVTRSVDCARKERAIP